MNRAGDIKSFVKIALVVCAVAAFWSPQLLRSQGAKHGQSQPSEPKPAGISSGASSSSRFVGDARCAKCHADKVASHKETGMARALSRAAESPILRSNTELNFVGGAYTYKIVRRKERSIYSVSDGSKTIEEPILWAFGHGEMGQTYVFEHQGKLYESRVSFYSAIKKLDITLGAPRNAPVSLMEAAGREMKSDDIKDCFGCHATNVVGGGRGDLDKLTPGVRCEACHGAGNKHVAAMGTGNTKEKNIAGLRGLSTEEQSNFCGACHRTWDQVMLLPGRGGIDNVRFQPYRLTNSRCYDTEDRRISCTSCHDPHEEVRREPAFYDAKCTACHYTAGAGAKNSVAMSSGKLKERHAPPCPTGRQQLCVMCHMPKIEVPGAHFKFTDHHIRVVTPSSKFPV